MNRESIEKDAKFFAWAHQYICVNKNTGVPHTKETPCPVSEMRMIPIANEIQHAYLCGALEAVRQCIAIIRDKADEYVDYGDWESAIPFGVPPSFNEEKFIQENFDIAPKATIAEILAKTEKMTDKLLSPEILTAAGWKEVPSELRQREFDKYEETEDGIINCFSIIFRPTIDRIAIEYSNGQTSLRLVKPAPITVEEFNTLLNIVKLEKFKIK